MVAGSTPVARSRIEPSRRSARSAVFFAPKGDLAEKDCVFVTPDPEATWVVTEYEPPHRIEFVKITPGLTAARIEIMLSAAGNDETHADVTYTHTALTAEGERFVEGFTEEYYERFMRGWEGAMNAYLERA